MFQGGIKFLSQAVLEDGSGKLKIFQNQELLYMKNNVFFQKTLGQRRVFAPSVAFLSAVRVGSAEMEFAYAVEQKNSGVSKLEFF